MNPLRIAVVGAGPAGLYAIHHLLETRGLDVSVDLFERLPTPWGLVRAAVAPDHPEKKLVIDRFFDGVLKHPRVRYLGNVEVGRDVSADELNSAYHAVLYAVGADDDLRMNLPGEDLPGCHAAREFVGWYSGHPDYAGKHFDLSGERAVIVGNGNVALDVARILSLPVDALRQTDIADSALAALAKSRIREVLVLGRRDAAHAAFNTPELEELGHLPGVGVRVEGGPASGDDADLKAQGVDWETRRKLATLAQIAALNPPDAKRRIILRFLASPLEVQGNGRVEQLRIAHNAMDKDAAGRAVARATGEESRIETGLVLRAIGYRGRPIPGLPFDEKRGVVTHAEGRVQPGVYVSGWIKRGPQGIIGTNKKCARDSVRSLLADLAAGRLATPTSGADLLLARIAERQPRLVDLRRWLAIDRAERDAGRAARRPRVKRTSHEELLGC